MANWKYKIDFKSFWDDEKMSVEEKALKASKILNKFVENHPRLDDESKDLLEDLAFQFQSVETFDEFNDVMEQLYDWGDTEIAPFGQWPRNKNAWINTF